VKILLDQNMPLLSAALLRGLGHDAVHTFEVGKDRWIDTDLIDLAIEWGAIIATRDNDFHAIIAQRSLVFPSTILIRHKTYDESIITDMVHSVCERFEPELLAGSIITANGRTIRLRSLPVARRGAGLP
jgi:predicted nuclease of predicted toxin-antitoxin system